MKQLIFFSFSLTLDSPYVSKELRNRLYQLNLTSLIILGKGHYVFTIDSQKWSAATWKKCCY
jgi:hypothetical protein